MKSIYKLHLGEVDGIDQYKIYPFNPCTIEIVNSNYVNEAVVLSQYITDAEALKVQIDDKVPYTLALIEMKKAYENLKVSNTHIDIEALIVDFSRALAELLAVLEDGEPRYETYLKIVLEKINENRECL